MSNRHRFRVGFEALVFQCALAGAMCVAAPTALVSVAQAQTRGPVQRTITGKVEDKAGHGIKGAVVYLKDGRTSSVKSAIAEDDGSYRFVQLSQNTDYEVWAQSGSKRSSTHSISSFDSKNAFDITLKISQ